MSTHCYRFDSPQHHLRYLCSWSSESILDADLYQTQQFRWSKQCIRQRYQYQHQPTPQIGKLVDTHSTAPSCGLVRCDDSTIQCPSIVKVELNDAVVIRLTHRLLASQSTVFMLAQVQ